VARTWIFTGSPENHAATQGHGFSVIEPGDRLVFYLTRVKAFGGSVRIEGELFEDREKIWPGKPGKVDAYPWRFPTSAEVVLEEAEWIPAESLAGELEHVAKWPREHWTLAFQGQIRAVSEHDAQVLMARLGEAAGVAA
jgi:hypothetical protein